jgi:hypothetical protein
VGVSGRKLLLLEQALNEQDLQTSLPHWQMSKAINCWAFAGAVSDVRCWHLRDIAKPPINVRFRG